MSLKEEMDDVLADGTMRRARTSTDTALLLQLSKHPSRFVRSAVAARKELSDERCREMALSDPSEHVRATIISRNRLDAKAIRDVWRVHRGKSVCAIAACPSTPLSILEEIVGIGEWLYTIWICWNPAVPSQLLKRIARIGEDLGGNGVELSLRDRYMALPPDDVRRVAYKLLEKRGEAPLHVHSIQ